VNRRGHRGGEGKTLMNPRVNVLQQKIRQLEDKLELEMALRAAEPFKATC
jgi:hypothetical protein